MERQARSQLLWLAACGIALATSWAFYRQSIVPLRQRETAISRDVAGMKERIDDARNTVSEIRVLEKDAESARVKFARLGDDLPAGSAMVWLPDFVKSHFASFNIDAPLVRLNTIQEEPLLPSYKRGYWSMALPVGETPRSPAELIFAVAALEQKNAFLRVLDFDIRPDPGNPKKRLALLNIAALIRN